MTAIEDRFFRPRRSVTLVDFGSTLEALCLRFLLEAMGVSVVVHFIGAPQDLFAVLDRTERPPEFLVLCGHGTEAGLFLGHFGEGIDQSSLVGGCLPAKALDGKIALPNTVVLSTACKSGTEAFARAFLGGGASLYIAPSSYPEATDTLLFAHQFFHATLAIGADAVPAAQGAARGCREPDTFLIVPRDREPRYN